MGIQVALILISAKQEGMQPSVVTLKQFSLVPVEKVKSINQAIETAKKVRRLPRWIRWMFI
jgi:hypothetical protein